MSRTFNIFLGKTATGLAYTDFTLRYWEDTSLEVDVVTNPWSWSEYAMGAYRVTVPDATARAGVYYLEKTVDGSQWAQGTVPYSPREAERLLLMRGLCGWQSIRFGITNVEWEGDPWPVDGAGIELTPCILQERPLGWQGDWTQAMFQIKGDANGVPVYRPDLTPIDYDPYAHNTKLLGVCDTGVSGDVPPLPEGRLTITGSHVSLESVGIGKNKVVIHLTGGKIECAWVDNFGNMMYESSFLNVSMAKLALASDAGGGGNGDDSNKAVEDLILAIGKLTSGLLVPGTLTNPYHVETDTPLVLYVQTDINDIEFVLGPQWSTYLTAPNSEVWFTAKADPRTTRTILDAPTTIFHPVEGIIRMSLTQSQLNVTPGTYFWQLQHRQPIYTGNPPILQSTKKHMLMEGKVYIKPKFKP